MATDTNGTTPIRQKKEYKATIERVVKVQELITNAPRQMDAETREQCLEELRAIQAKITAWHGGRLRFDPSAKKASAKKATRRAR